jgi:choline dehydrogenase-like flavoprotein
MSDVGADIVVIGSGPAGVSAALPLVEAGRRVVMIDSGRDTDPPADAPWRRMLGAHLEALRPDDGLSPKLRTPEARRLLGAFHEHQPIGAEDFLAIGALGRGGLSRIWGAFACELQGDDLQGWPLTPYDLRSSYDAVVARIGVSGSHDDDMAAFYGPSDALQAAPPLGPTAAAMFKRYCAARPDPQFALGRARNALITENRWRRQSCDFRLGCLWGCERGAIYDSRQDLALLRQHANFELRSATAQRLVRADGGWDVITTHGERLHAPRLVVAAGTLGSLRLVAPLLAPATKLRVLNSPVMAVPLLVTARLGGKLPTEGHSLAHLGFRLACSEKPGDYVSGAIYETAGLPPASFAARMPFGRRAATEIFRALAPALAVATVYFPGHYSANTVTLRPSPQGDQGDQGDQADEAPQVEVRGGVAPGFDEVVRTVRQRLTTIWRKLGARPLPGVALATAGTDAHLGGVFPMGVVAPHGTNNYGELHAAPRLYLVDGSVLPSIPSKFTTLTIMANADRIGRYLAEVA